LPRPVEPSGDPMSGATETTAPQRGIDAVIFDMDGVIVDSEHVWNEARERLARERGGRWHANAQRDTNGHALARLGAPRVPIAADCICREPDRETARPRR
jgi:hypothetical protein